MLSAFIRRLEAFSPLPGDNGSGRPAGAPDDGAGHGGG